MQGQQNYPPQGQQEYAPDGQQNYSQGQQDYAPDGQQNYPQGQQEYAPDTKPTYSQGQGLNHPQPATLREGGIASVNPGGNVHEIPLHDNRTVGAPVHTVVPPVSSSPGVTESTEKRHSGTGVTRAPGSNTGGVSGGSGGKVAGLAVGSIAFLLLAFLVLWQIALLGVASRILHLVKINAGDLRLPVFVPRIG